MPGSRPFPELPALRGDLEMAANSRIPEITGGPAPTGLSRFCSQNPHSKYKRSKFQVPLRHSLWRRFLAAACQNQEDILLPVRQSERAWETERARLNIEIIVNLTSTTHLNERGTEVSKRTNSRISLFGHFIGKSWHKSCLL